MRNGDLLGERYRLDEFVDGGAMGEVWRATDTRLSRTVAVKVLHASLSGSPSFRRRFETEARSAAGLRAPGVVNVYDFGEDFSGDGASKSFLVMEFVDGRPLSAILADDGTLTPGDTMALMGKVAAALDAAHRAGVIHRDIKPGNILLTEDGTVKVVDFGIARAQGEAGLTGTGQVMGTVAYVSPEQLYDEELTGRSDVYSLGVVAYECLAGHKPFNADAPAAVIRAQLHETPAPLPATVPASVSDVVMKCLEKESDKRWESAAVLAKRCRQLAATLPQGESTQEMAAAARDDDDVTVRVAAPAVASAAVGTRALPSASGDGDGVTGNRSPRGGAAVLREHKKLIGIMAIAFLGLVILTGAVWSIGASGDEGGGKPGKNTSTSSSDASTSEPESTDDEQTDQYTGEPSTSDTTSEPSSSSSSSSQEPSSSTATSSDDDDDDDDDETSSDEGQGLLGN